MKTFIIKHKLPIIIFCIALVVRLILFSMNFAINDYELLPTIKGDDGYYELSQGILNGHGFTWDTEPPYDPNPLRPPLWPYLIAFFVKAFGTYWAVFAFEMLLGSFIPVLAFYIAKKLWNKDVGKWTAVVMCLEPYLILFSFILYTETSFIFFFLLSFLFLLKYIEKRVLRNAMWFGVFLAMATLIKPTVQFLPILVPLGLAIIWRKSLSWEYGKHFGAFLFVFLALLAPWFYRNKVEFGVWGISAQPAFNLYVYLVPTVLAIDNNTDFQTELNLHLEKDFNPNTITLTNSPEYTKKALDILNEHKIAIIKSGLITLVTFFTHDGMLTVFGYSDVRFENIVTKPAIYFIFHPGELISTIIYYSQSPAIFIFIMRFFWILVTISFIFGVWRCFRKEGISTAALTALCLIIYFAATTAINGFGVNARFRMPVDVFLLGFAIYGLFSLKRDNTAIANLK